MDNDDVFNISIFNDSPDFCYLKIFVLLASISATCNLFTFLVFQVCEHEKKLHTQQQLLVKVNKQLDEKLKTLQGIPIIVQTLSINKTLSLLPSLCQTSQKIHLF
jgi:hypothetical protein